MEQHFDLLIIGGGPAGYIAAAQAGKNGLQTALVAGGTGLGGTCLQEGCIPSKVLLESSELLVTMQNSSKFGIVCAPASVSADLTAIMQRKQNIINKLAEGIKQLLDLNKVTLFSCQARLDDLENKVYLANGDILTATDIILAVGSVPSQLPFAPFDNDYIISSTNALSLPEIPASLTILGGGAIGLELGSVWARLGSRVTIIEMLPQLAGHADRQLATLLERSLKKQGLTIHTASTVKNVEINNGRVITTIDKKGQLQTITSDKLLVAAGRRPNTGVLPASICLTERGFIKVDETFTTSRPHIRAIGDCIGGAMLAHKAEDEGRAVIDLILNKSTKVQTTFIPSVIYTNPELAMVGLTEQEAKEQNIATKTGKCYLAANGRALSMEAADGLIKVLVENDSHKILGWHILGAHASELIAPATITLQQGLTVSDLAAVCHAHPTLAEAMREACLELL